MLLSLLRGAMIEPYASSPFPDIPVFRYFLLSHGVVSYPCMLFRSYW